MPNADIKGALVSYRLESAKEKLKAAVDLLEKGDYKDSVSRSYYAIFTAARALLATKLVDSMNHSGVAALLKQHFVKAGIIDKTTSQMIEKAKLYGEQADYGDFFVVSGEEAAIQVESAKKFISDIEGAIREAMMGLKGRN